MNKTQLVEALATRLGDRKTAALAVDGVLDTIVDTVKGGDSVSITGFGVFEPRARAARVARNPRTGEAVDVAATTVPAFRAGAGFRTAVGGSAPAPRAAPARRRTAAAATDTAPAAAAKAPKSPKAAAPKTAVPKAAPKSAAKAVAAKAAAPKSAAKAAPAKTKASSAKAAPAAADKTKKAKAKK